MADSPSIQFEFSEGHDVNDGKPWTAEELEDLALALKDGGTIEGAADFLGRWGTQQDVRQKAEELGLMPESAK